TYLKECLITSNIYSIGDNDIQVFQGYLEGNEGVATGLFKTWKGATLFDEYYKTSYLGQTRTTGKLFKMCLYGTPNGETYTVSDDRWNNYPLNTEWEKIGGNRPPQEGGGDCDSPGQRCVACLTSLSANAYERKTLNLNVVGSGSPPVVPPIVPEWGVFLDFIKNYIFYIIAGILIIIIIYLFWRKK
ncbi:MAG: hypothetical protein AABY22_04750, partial [Nanoarchaeota archaeon]